MNASSFAQIKHSGWERIEEEDDSEYIDSSRNSWWYGGQAKENYETKNYKKAIEYYSFAIRLDSLVPEFYYYRGHAYAFNKQPGQAFVDLKKAIVLNPSYLTEINDLGWEYFKRGDLIGALRYFFSYLELMPQKPSAILFGGGLKGNYTQMLKKLGWESLRNNNLPKSIDYFSNYLKLSPNDPDAYLGLALVYYMYLDYDNALQFLNEAKKLAPILYKGYSGVATLEKIGFSYSTEDKMIMERLFRDVNSKSDDFFNLTKASVWKFVLAFLYLFLGIGAFSIFIFRIKRFEGYIFYLGVLNFSFGAKFLYDNPLIQLSEVPTLQFWESALPLISFIIPVVFILFIRYFIGWGWKRSILWLLIYSLIQGVFKLLVDYDDPAKYLYDTTNTMFGFLAAIVLFLHLFLPGMRKNREVQIISAGLGFYLLAIVYENLVHMQWINTSFSFDEPAYLFFNICLIYIAFRRITDSEKEYLTVKQDLETARNIQNAILPEKSPKSEAYEISSAYIPMALIGGDYYDYQIQDESHIGVLIADVSGHGISAALIASMLKVAFNSQLNNAHLPSVVLEQINHSLSGQLNNEFITAGYLGLDTKTKKLTYSSAGHPPLVIYRRKNNEISELRVDGIPIGVFPEAAFKETSLQLMKGDRLIMYTDGISEVFNPAGEIFGKERFIDLIKETKNLVVEDAKESILEHLQKWSRKKERETHDDDITLIIFDVL